MLALALVATVLSHNQNGRKDCSLPIHIDDDDMSQSFWIENETCTFQFHTRTLCKPSVHRVSPPLLPGHITINGKQIEFVHNSTGFIEPFSLVPMWPVYEADEVFIGTTTVKVHAEGKAIFSFGTAEDMSLTLANVVPEAYETREWVYCMPVTFMWSTHMFFLLAATVVWSFKGLESTLLVLVSWIFVSVTVDLSVWTALAADAIGGFNNDGWLLAVTLLRVLVYLFLLYTLLEKPAAPPGEWGGLLVWGLLVPALLCAYVVSLAQIAEKSVAFMIFTALGLLVVQRIIYVRIPYMNFIIFLTLLANALNIGAFVLVPFCLWHAYSRKTKLFQSPYKFVNG